MDYFFHIVIVVAIFVILAISLNIISGYTGLFSLAHGAFYGLGSYATALLLLNLGVNFFVALIGAIVITVGISALVAIMGLRTKRDYLVLVTLGIQMITVALLVNLRGLTRGYQGLIDIPRPEFFGVTLISPAQYLPLVIVLSCLSFYLVWRITKSPFGRVLKAIREDEDVALSFGKDVYRFKIQAFMVAGGIAAVAGALFAAYSTYINPAYFGIEISILVFAVVAIGGMSNLWGSVVGAILLVGVPEALIFGVGEIKIGNVEVIGVELVGALRTAIYGALLIAFMRLRPQGIIPEYMRLGWGKAPVYERLSPEESEAILWGVGANRELWEAQDNQEPLLQVKGLVKEFGGIRAADNLTLTLTGNRIVALIGPNGAGKTTAYNLITNFLKVDDGRVYYRGRDITKFPPHKISRLGLVRSFQGGRVLDNISVLDNVLLARPKQNGENLLRFIFYPRGIASEDNSNRRYAMACLEFVGLADKAQLLAAELPFGQKKRLQIACLLATEADVLLLDEPVSGVDPAWIGDMMELMRKLVSHGKTICIIEHNLDVVKDVAAFAYFLDQGRVVAKGTPAALMANRELADLYFGVSVKEG